MKSVLNRVAPLLVAAFCSILGAGCATQASLTVTSQPEGAFITEKRTGTTYGIAPIAVVYDRAALLKSRGPDGCFLVGGFEARWASGAVASLETVRLCGSNVGAYRISLDRDPAQPGFDKDLQFAIQVQQLRVQQEQKEQTSTSQAISVAEFLIFLSSMRQNK